LVNPLIAGSIVLADRSAKGRTFQGLRRTDQMKADRLLMMAAIAISIAGSR